MKLFAFIFVLIALVFSTTSALKDEICGLDTAKNSVGLIACAGYLEAWSYDPAQNNCVKFIYGGCGGNDNRFDSEGACQAKCVE